MDQTEPRPSTSAESLGPPPDKILYSETKKMLKRILKTIVNEEKSVLKKIPVEMPFQRATRYTGLTMRTLREMEINGVPPQVDFNMDRNIIQNKLVSFYLTENHIPSLDELFNIVSIPHHIDIDNFKTILYDMGYVLYKNPDDKELYVIEDQRVVFERYNYLKKIQQYRNNNLPIVYIGIAAVKDCKIINLKESVHETLHENDVDYCFFTVTKNKIDHVCKVETLTPETLKSWLENQVSHELSPGSICVINDSELCRKTFIDVPTVASTKVDMVDWLDDHNIPCDISMPKSQLLDLIEACTDTEENTYEIDNVMKIYNHNIMRLPKCIYRLSSSTCVLRHINEQGIPTTSNVADALYKFKETDLISLHKFVNSEELKLLEEELKVDEIMDSLVKNLRNIITIDDDDDENYARSLRA